MRKMTQIMAIVSFLVIAGASRADLVIQAPTIEASQGESGSFDLVIYSIGGTYQVADDPIELALTGLAGVKFTDVTIATTIP